MVHAGGGTGGGLALLSTVNVALAGVPDDIIAADYAVSAELLTLRTEFWRQKAIEEGEDMARFERRAACIPESMLEVLDGLRMHYGGVAAYLGKIGLSSDEIAALETRLVE